jgi:hypothetical protein
MLQHLPNNFIGEYITQVMPVLCVSTVGIISIGQTVDIVSKILLAAVSISYALWRWRRDIKNEKNK